MTEQRSRYPDVSDILAHKAAGRRQRAALTFADKLGVLDALKERMDPIVRAREFRRQRKTQSTSQRS